MALGLLETIKPYLHDGLLTVIDPNVSGDSVEAREVDLLFDGAAKPGSGQRAA